MASAWAACAFCWLARADYDGIIHDSTLYAFQALARVIPDALGHDIALRFASQDDYSIFSAVFAPLIAAIGLDPAALAISIVSNVLLLLAAWWLARRLYSPALALLGLLFALALPGSYGDQRVFHLFEMFATPRPAAEALALLAIGASLARRHAWSVVALAATFALHPVIALPALAVVAAIMISTRRAALGVAAALAALTILAVATLPRMDAEWLGIVRERSPYLFVSSWGIESWTLLAPRAATLAIVFLLAAASPARRLAAAASLALFGGLLASLLFADALRLALAIQAQFWRVTWVASLVAMLLLPWLIDAARRDARACVATLMLAAAWIVPSDLFALGLSVASVVLAVLPARVIEGARWSRPAATAVLGAALLAALISLVTVFDIVAPAVWEPHAGRVVNMLRTATLAPAAGALFALAAYWVYTRTVSQTAGAVILASLVVAVLAVLPFAWTDWTRSRMPPELQERFASWREIIPADSEVFCLDDARTCWFLLNRASYISATQSAGALFSRDAAILMRARAREMAALVDPSELMSWTMQPAATAGGVAAACKASRADYIELPAAADIEPRGAPLAELAGLRLYRCDGD